MTTSGTPQPIGACPSCGGARYAGLTHQCVTTVKVGGVIMRPGETVTFGQGGTLTALHNDAPQLFSITGLCTMGQHGFCQNRVYLESSGIRDTVVPCECDCHAETEAKAA